MERNSEKYNLCISLMEREMVPALGCTEPICIAYAAAKARSVLGCLPDRMVVRCSPNIIKNVKSVIVPTSIDLKGIPAAAVLGMVGGDSTLELEVLRHVTTKDLDEAKALLEQGICTAYALESKAKLHVIVEEYCGSHSAVVEIIHSHNSIVRIEKDGAVLMEVPHTEDVGDGVEPLNMGITDVFDFARTVELADVEKLLECQISYNWAISEEGLKKPYGACIGRRLLQRNPQDPWIEAEARAAAGSDARMSGCEMPVVINSGSGNQGITVSVPIISMAHHLNAPHEKLLRALCLGNLVALYQKSQVGRLSAYCGAITAASGAAAGISYLMDKDDEVIAHAIINTLVIASGIVCDGAKPSCAAKISAGIHAAAVGIDMACDNNNFSNGEGLVKQDLEKTITCISTLARDGMRQTDDTIINLMMRD